MRSVLADTGPLYALLDPSDGHHARAKAESRRLSRARTSVLVPYPALLETHTLALRRLGLGTARRWLREIHRSAGLLNPQPDDYDRAVALLERFRDQPITLVDAVLAVLGQETGQPIWTFDHHFDVMAAKVWR